MEFRIIPVIDLKGGIAVHARGGERAQYRPLESVWQASPSPIGLAEAVRDGLGCDTLYVADLDAIESVAGTQFPFHRLADRRLDLWLDVGIRDVTSLAPFLDPSGRQVRVVVGLESVRGLSALRAVIEQIGADRVVFSLDLRDGMPVVSPWARWTSAEPEDIIAVVSDLGVHRVILLDLARVGSGRGTGTDALLAHVVRKWPATSFIAGGGVRGLDDVLRLEEMGASGVLVGSAIHDGRIGRQELERIAAAGVTRSCCSRCRDSRGGS